MLKNLTIAAAIFAITSAACTTAQTTNSGGSPADISNGTAAANTPNANAETKPVAANSNAKTFLGNIKSERVQINLTREGNSLSGTYSYTKVGTDLKLSGTIDAAGNFTLQETDAAGGKTGEWKGIWKEDGGRVTLTGKWKSPKGSTELDFSADEQVTEFKSGAKIVNKILKESNKEKRYAITAEYPELTGIDAATAVNFNQSGKKIAADANKRFKENIADLTAEDLKRFTSDDAALYEQLTYSVELANDDVISLLFEDDSYTGGAHGSSITTTVNFDLKNNRELKLADIFVPNANYLKTLSESSLTDLKAQKIEATDDETLNDGTTPKEENFRSWNLTKKGLQINFDAYQVASYAAGPQIVVIPYDKLRDILRKDGAAARLAK